MYENEKYFHIILAFVMIFSVAFSYSDAPIKAAEVPLRNSRNIPNIQVKDQINNAVNQPLSENSNDIQPASQRNNTWVASITIYPAIADLEAGEVNWDSGIWLNVSYDNSRSPVRVLNFTQEEQDELLRRMKQSDGVDATGWWVEIVLSVETIAPHTKLPAELYLKLNEQELEPYPYPVQDGTSVDIFYYTASADSSVTGYIEYNSGLTTMISTGTLSTD